MSELPDWLRDLQPLDEDDAPGAASESAGDVPDWLRDLRPRDDDDLSALGRVPAAPVAAPVAPPEQPSAYPSAVQELFPQPEPTLEESLLAGYQDDYDDLDEPKGKKVRKVDTAKPASSQKRPARRKSGQGAFLGLSPWQRFILALFLFMDIAIVGLLFLAMTGRIAP